MACQQDSLIGRSAKLLKAIVANQEGICEMGQIHVDDMTLEILCNDVCDFQGKICRSSVKNVFCKYCPNGGARGDQCEKADWRLLFAIQGVCVQSLALIGATVPDRRFQSHWSVSTVISYFLSILMYFLSQDHTFFQ